ncbi:MAG TPA: cation:dicarboxylase symporter family transporter [Bryobacteraceae bacterium]|nr:cation:dicarboxylase symporter family transporter [Bryobacteraceae bacterium]
MALAVKRPSLTAWILIALLAGVVFGTVFPGPAQQMGLLGTIFLRLIKSIIAPLIFATLVTGIASAGSLKIMGRIGLKAIVYFEIVTTLALAVGLGAANLVRPGEGIALNAPPLPEGIAAGGASLKDMLERAFPASVVDAMARGDVLEIVVFAILFGAACAAIGAKAQPVLDVCKSLASVMFRYTDYVMWAAPLGVFGAIASTVGERGLKVLVGLGKLVGTLWGAEIFFVVAVMGAVVAIARIPLAPFVRASRAPFLIAFSTASSEAALPRALENMESIGVPQHIAALVLPLGYSFNLDGGTLYLALTSIFVAQAAGIHLTLGAQLTMMLTLMLISKGIAGVPRGSFVILAGAVAAFHLPAEGVALILGVDTLMDMARTSVNLLGNCLASAVIARWEGVELHRSERIDAAAITP